MKLYLSNDSAAVAVGADCLAGAWAHAADVELVRTSSRGAFFLEPLVERDGPHGRIAWPNARPEDLARIRAGEGGTRIADIPFLSEQTRATFAGFGLGRPLSLLDYGRKGGLAGLARANALA